MPLDTLPPDSETMPEPICPPPRPKNFDPDPTPPPDTGDANWFEELELMRWADDGGANFR